MRICFLLSMCLLALLAGQGNLFAQEVQVPLDADGRIMVIDPQLEQRINVFPEVTGFQEARLFQISETEYALEILSSVGGQMVRSRRPLSAGEVRQFRALVTERIGTDMPRPEIDQQGRRALLIGSTALSTLYYGWAIPVALGVEDGRLATGLYLLTGSAGFFVPYLLTRDAPVPEAATTLGLYGATRGILHGFLLGGLLLGETDDFRALVGMSLVSSVAEGVAGYALANRLDPSVAEAELIGSGGDFGLAMGAGTAFLLFEWDDVRVSAGTTLLGAGAGLVAGRLLAARQPYTRGDVRVLQTTGVLGAYVPAALLAAANVDEPRPVVAMAMAGGVAGVALGHYLTRHRDFTLSQASYIALGASGGYLLGAGIGTLVSEEEERAVAALSAVGATVGFWLMYRAYAHEAAAAARTSSFHLQVAPLPAVGNASLRMRPGLKMTYQF